ncbi:hypothetical protein PMI31_05488, partial [Pseudomonas sp. GM55]
MPAKGTLNSLSILKLSSLASQLLQGLGKFWTK